MSCVTFLPEHIPAFAKKGEEITDDTLSNYTVTKSKGSPWGVERAQSRVQIKHISVREIEQVLKGELTARTTP